MQECWENKDGLMDSEGLGLVGERIMSASRKLAEHFSSEIDIRRIGIDQQYTDELQAKLIEPALLKYVRQERLVVQCFFEVDPALLPQVKPDDSIFGVVVYDEKRDGLYKITQTVLKRDFNRENPYMDWYYRPVAARSGVWSDIYFDPYLNMEIVTYSLPVYIDGTLVGVVGMDLDYADFHRIMNKWLIENFQSKIAVVQREHKALGQQEISIGRYLNLDTLQVVGADEMAEGIVTQSSQMQRVLKTAVKAAVSNANILILGETGVGKDFVASFIHDKSQQAKGSFVNVNCSAIPETLLESEFFGYVKGAFTGAKNEGKPGFFEMADGGTIFLNEVGEIPLHLQAKFLSVIQQRLVVRLGATKSKHIDFRVIAATNKNLFEQVKRGEFREDLYYRLNVIPIVIPPLRQRRDDITSLLNFNLHRICERYGVHRRLSPVLVEKLIAYDWPGNVRELENMIERLVVTSEDQLIDDATLTEFADMADSDHASLCGQTLKEMMETYEADIFRSLHAEGKSSYKIAEELGISQSQASKKLRSYVNPGEV